MEEILMNISTFEECGVKYITASSEDGSVEGTMKVEDGRITFMAKKGKVLAEARACPVFIIEKE